MSQHLERARILLDLKRPAQAEQEVRRELAVRPENPEAHRLLARSLFEQGRLAEAQAELQETIRLQPDCDYAHRLHGCILTAQGSYQPARYQLAEQAIREALRLNPYDSYHFYSLAYLFHQQERWSECADAARDGLRIDPDNLCCANLLAKVLIEMKRGEEAQEILTAVMAKNPEDAWSHTNQGWLCLNQKKPTEALQHFREAARLDPETPKLHRCFNFQYVNGRVTLWFWLFIAFCFVLLILSLLKRLYFDVS